jgi:predicted nucleotidyltransferase
MLSVSEKKIIAECARKYNVASVYVFGSSASSREYNDIDLGVKGIEQEKFFKFYGELIDSLSKPVDLVDLSDKTLFTKLVEKEGVRIYG